MVREISVKIILNRHRKRDEWFLDDYSLNPYQLCEFNCLYCYIRGSKYGGDLRSDLAVKVNAPELLEKELRRRSRRGEYGFIAISSATEPWMYIEKKYRITRRCLDIIAKYRFPVHCLTKSTLILRDLDLLHEIDRNAILPSDLSELGHGTLITFSISSLDDKIAAIFEPNAPRPMDRLKTLEKVKDAGFYAGIAYMPVLPYISDSDDQLMEMIKTAKEFRADYVFFGDLTLYGVGKRIYFKILEKYFPELYDKYLEIYRSGSYIEKTYRRRFYNRVKILSRRYGLKLGILNNFNE